MKNLSLLLIFLMSVLMVVISCTKKEFIGLNNSEVESLTENYSVDFCESVDFDINTFQGAIALQIATSTVTLFDSLFSVAERQPDFEVLNNLLISQIDSIGDYAEFSNIAMLYYNILGIDSAIVTDFYYNIATNANFIVAESNYDILEAAFYHIACNEVMLIDPYDLQSRRIFRTLARVFGAHCSIGVVAGLVDTVIAASTTVLLTSTGPGLALGAIAVADSYTNMILDANDCINQ